MNKWLSMIYDRVLCICRSVDAKQLVGVQNSLTSMEIVDVGYYDFTDFGVPAGAKITQFSVTVTASAVVSVHGYVATFGSGTKTVTASPGTFIDPAATVIDVSAISGGEITFDVQYYTTV